MIPPPVYRLQAGHRHRYWHDGIERRIQGQFAPGKLKQVVG